MWARGRYIFTQLESGVRQCLALCRKEVSLWEATRAIFFLLKVHFGILAARDGVKFYWRAKGLDMFCFIF